MNVYVAVLLFVAYFASGTLYALFVRYASEGAAAKAANCSILITLLMTTSVMKCMENPLYLIPVLAGNWLGTYSTLLSPKQTRRLIDYAWSFYHLRMFAGHLLLATVRVSKQRGAELIRQFRIW